MSTQRSTRYVRVSEADLVTEISAWSGRPNLADASLLAAPQRFPLAGPGRTPVAAAPSKEGREFNFWALIAAMLLGVVGGAAAMFVIRRRTRPAL